MLDNKEGGNVSVAKGYFTDKSMKYVRDFLAHGKILSKQPNGLWRVIDGENIVAKVGDTEYDKLQEAVDASSESSPAILQKDVTVSSLNGCSGKQVFLDLNAKTLTIDPVQDGQTAGGYGNLVNTHLTITNGNIVCSTIHSSIFKLIGAEDPTATESAVLTIGKDVVVTQNVAQDAAYEYFVAVQADKAPYGIVVNFNGTYNGTCPFYIHGDLVQQGDNMPTFNIGNTAKLECGDALAYAAGYGIWNYAGTATTEKIGFEIRAGKLNMTGGSITCNATTPADDQFNGSGSTSQACGIAVCQHSTKLPIEVTVSGGKIEAYTPLYQANPQNNADEISDVKMTVTGGQFFAHSKNVVWALNKRIFLEGGVYNQNPSVYAAAGKVAVANTDTQTKGKYPWTIGDVKAGITFNGTTNAEWSNAANWSGNAVATAETPAIINADVTISGKAEAYGITVATGKKITIQKGGVLMVGKDGISGITSADQLIIEDGGALLISPAATTYNQPLATAKKKIHVGTKETLEDPTESKYIRYHMGIPTVTKPTIVKTQTIGLRGWNTVSGWQDATDYFATPFKGYSATAPNDVAADVEIAFEGTVIGNDDATLDMPRRGFHFFANGWLAPIDTKELLDLLNALKLKGKMEVSIKTHKSDDTFNDINMETLKNDPSYAEIAPMTGFFLLANEATPLFLTYEKAVWNAQLAKKQNAPKRVMAAETDKNAVRIKLMAANGRQDNVYIYDGEEFHSTKMMNAVPNVNIYVEGEGNYSTFASEDLEGTMIAIQTNSQTNYSLSFDWLRGETLYIKDLQTNVVTAMTEGNVYNFTATANETSRRFIISRHNTTTTVDNIDVNTAAKGVYSITGQYLGESNIVETLPQGIYVVDGKKVIK